MSHVPARPASYAETRQEWLLVRAAIGFTAWAEKWFPDAFVFVAIAVGIAALANGASPVAVSQAFGNGFWSLITFTVQMAFVAIGGYVVATSAPAARLIRAIPPAPRAPAARAVPAVGARVHTPVPTPHGPLTAAAPIPSLRRNVAIRPSCR